MSLDLCTRVERNPSIRHRRQQDSGDGPTPDDPGPSPDEEGTVRVTSRRFPDPTPDEMGLSQQHPDTPGE